MADFAAFLDDLHSSVQALDQSSMLHVTVGNESCDLDSMVSALAHAHFLSRRQGGGGISLPLFQCQRNEFNLRSEAVWLFKELKVDPLKLVFMDDLPPERLSSVGQLSLTLVDHHLPSPPFQGLSASITEVIDHHRRVEGEGEEGAWKSNVEPVGSCSTLIAEKLISEVGYEMEGVVATLLLAAILLDTVNLRESEGRVVEKDRVVAGKLFPISSIPQEQLYQSVFKARFNTTGITTPQLLQRDFKLVCVSDYRLGFSTITTLLSDLLQREGMADNLAAFFHANSLHTLILLGISASPDGQKRRQIVLYQPPPSTPPPPSYHDLADSLASVLEMAEELGCERVAGLEVTWPLLEQHNTAKSRKNIIPLVTEFMLTVEKEGSGVHAEQKTLEAAVLDVSSEHPVPLEPKVTVVTPPEGGAQTPATPRIPEYSVEEETKESRTYRLIQLGGEEVTINLSLIQPYKKIVQHAGYIGEQRRALVVISACYLPPHSLPNYSIIINQLFYYVLSVLDHLVVDDYIIVYLHSGSPRHSMPSVKLLHRFYKMIDRRLRKQLIQLYIVHPSLWVKTIMRLGRPFISGKFYHKVHFMRTLHDLSAHVTLEEELVPAPVIRADVLLSPPELRYKVRADSQREKSQEEPPPPQP